MTSEDLALDVVVPDTRVGRGLLSVDAFKVVTGKPLEHFLAGFLRGPTSTRKREGARDSTVYPLSIPVGMGITVPLPPFGELGVANAGRGLLSVTYPPGIARSIDPLLEESGLCVGEPQEMCPTEWGPLRQRFVRTPSKARLVIPIPKLGELGLEVP